MRSKNAAWFMASEAKTIVRASPIIRQRRSRHARPAWKQQQLLALAQGPDRHEPVAEIGIDGGPRDVARGVHEPLLSRRDAAAHVITAPGVDEEGRSRRAHHPR